MRIQLGLIIGKHFINKALNFVRLVFSRSNGELLHFAVVLACMIMCQYTIMNRVGLEMSCDVNPVMKSKMVLAQYLLMFA